MQTHPAKQDTYVTRRWHRVAGASKAPQSLGDLGSPGGLQPQPPPG